jgi:hypothetical protein
MLNSIYVNIINPFTHNTNTCCHFYLMMYRYCENEDHHLSGYDMM